MSVGWPCKLSVLLNLANKMSCSLARVVFLLVKVVRINASNFRPASQDGKFTLSDLWWCASNRTRATEMWNAPALIRQRSRPFHCARRRWLARRPCATHASLRRRPWRTCRQRCRPILHADNMHPGARRWSRTSGNKTNGPGQKNDGAMDRTCPRKCKIRFTSECHFEDNHTRAARVPISRMGVSNSARRPASNTITLSASAIVLSRCAIVNTVAAAKQSRIAC